MRFLIDLLFPKTCFICDKWGIYLCYSCSKKLRLHEFQICSICRKESYFGLTHQNCKNFSSLDSIQSVFYYKGNMGKIIKQLKYHFVKDAFDDVLKAVPYKKWEEFLLYKKITSEWECIPVPLHSKRLKMRGYNQADVIASYFSYFLQIPFNKTIVRRIKYAPPQAQCETYEHRKLNIKDAFILEEEVNGKNFIIVDDVFTSGSTIGEIAKLLKQNGAEKVMGLTLAR